ncbi:hypothetical protein V5E97_21200 [Singulisphaera sp. Ch08]|uniref:Uncharacterized protein n=1 Tax=Singulisphaera sp. Ch08 TaxID=3120278 RepID=A0AAU7C6I1_9BACT
MDLLVNRAMLGIAEDAAYLGGSYEPLGAEIGVGGARCRFKGDALGPEMISRFRSPSRAERFAQRR